MHLLFSHLHWMCFMAKVFMQTVSQCKRVNIELNLHWGLQFLTAPSHYHKQHWLHQMYCGIHRGKSHRKLFIRIESLKTSFWCKSTKVICKKALFETWKQVTKIKWGIKIYVKHDQKQWKSWSLLCQTHKPTIISNLISKSGLTSITIITTCS